ncbi:MAG: hypothetical protein ACK56W_11380 [Pirellula sp.]
MARLILCCCSLWLPYCRGEETKATIVGNFLCPWTDAVPQSTTFESWLDSDRFHLRFTVEDSDVILQEKWTGEDTLDHEDRVVFAISSDIELGQLYCIELDAQGRIRDAKRDVRNQIDSSWTCDGLQTTSQRTDRGYIVSATMPIATLKSNAQQPIDASSKILVGLFRADHNRSSIGTTWSSWQLPATLDSTPFVRSAMSLLPVQGGRYLNPVESTRARSLRIARDKVRRDWYDHLQRDGVKKRAEQWFDSLADFPSIPEAWTIGELTFIAAVSERPFQWESSAKEPLNYRPFSVSITIDKSEQGDSNNNGMLVELTEATTSERVRIRSDQGRIAFEMEALNLAMSIVTIDAHDIGPRDSISVTSEGTGSVQDLAIYLNGQRLKAIPVRENQPNSIPMQSPVDTQRQWILKSFQTPLVSFQLRNRVLSEIEIRSLNDRTRLLTWGEQSEAEYAAWVDHYARRIDTEGGYLLESLRHYR